MDTITEKQRVETAAKLEKMFGRFMPRQEAGYCPIRDVMALASDKWSILIVLYLGYFPVLRFNALKKKVYGISNKVLSERLKVLESDGYIVRNMYPEVPIRVEYGLTPFGFEYLQKLLDLTDWITRHSDEVIRHRKSFEASST